MNLAPVEEANGDDAFLDDLVCTVEGDAYEVLLLLAGDVLQQRQDISHAGNLDGVTFGEAAGEFEGGEKLVALGRPNTAISPSQPRRTG
jgi:hypothetical protein